MVAYDEILEISGRYESVGEGWGYSVCESLDLISSALNWPGDHSKVQGSSHLGSSWPAWDTQNPVFVCLVVFLFFKRFIYCV